MRRADAGRSEETTTDGGDADCNNGTTTTTKTKGTTAVAAAAAAPTRARSVFRGTRFFLFWMVLSSAFPEPKLARKRREYKSKW